MSYKEKPIIKLYKYENNSFVMQAQIDDFQEVSFEHNIYEAGTFTITINYNIPNALKFQRGLFVQFGNNPYDFGEIITIQDAIVQDANGQDGKGSQIRTITGRDARYILKRRVIKNMNSNGLWAMTDKGEIVLRNLIKDQCGSSAEAKRQLPISNTIPSSADAKGKEYSASENFSNLYEVCKTIATQSEIGWRMAFDGTLTLEVFEGADLSQTVRFDTSYESLANGEFSDSSDAYSNAIYIGGKGQNDDRDIYEGEDGTPQGLDRFESWDNQSSLTIESEYEAEALSMLTQYGQTLTMNGNGLAKCPYVFREQYDIGDTVTVAFSGKSAKAQILSITEHWTWGSYDISFAFGKPQNNLADQLQLMLRKIQEASNKTNSTDSVRWYTIPTDTAMPKADVTYNTIGFVGTCASGGSTFTLYLDNEKTGAKTYHVYFKQLGGTGKLTLTTGKSGATNLVMEIGTYVAIIYVDENGNITSQGMTATSTVSSGNSQPVTSGGVYQQIAGQVYTSGDLNTFKTVGTYQFNGASVTNVPVKALASNLLYGTLEVFYWGNGNIIQRLTSTVEGVIAVYIRRYSNYGSWAIWFKQRNATSTVLDSGTDLNDIDTIGIYGLDGIYTNLPQNVSGSGILVVDNYPPNYNSFVQTLTIFLSGKAFVYTRRKYDGGTWGTWFPLTMNWTTAETVAGTFGANNDVVYKLTVVTTLPETTTGTIAYKLIDLGVSINKIIKFEGAVTNRSGNQWQYAIPMVTESGYKITCQLYQGKLRIATDWRDVATGEARITIYYTK